MTSRSAIELALRCYPSWWRERYADEVRVVSNDLTAEGRSTFMVTSNLLRGAVRARSRAQGMPKTYGLWSTRTKTSIAAATLPWLVVAPLAVMAIGNQTLHSSAGLVNWSGFSFFPTQLQLQSVTGTPVPAPPLTSGGQAVLYAMFAFVMLFLLTFIVLISGWSGLSGAIRRSAAPHRRRLMLLAWAPVFSLLIDVVLMCAQSAVRYPARYVTGGEASGHLVPPHMVPYGGHPSAAHALAVIVPTVAGIGWLVSVSCVAMAARRAQVRPSDLRFGKSVSTMVAALSAFLVLAFAAMGVGLIVQARQAAEGSFTTISFPRQDLWLPMILVLLTTGLLSWVSALVARRSWRVISVSFD
jgi:hypothetical protein